MNYCHNCGHWEDLATGHDAYCSWCLRYYYDNGTMPKVTGHGKADIHASRPREAVS